MENIVDKRQSILKSALKIGRKSLVIGSIVSLELLSACGKDPKVNKFEKRIEANKALERKNKEETEFGQAKIVSDAAERESDKDPKSIDKAKIARDASEITAKEREESEQAKKDYEQAKKDADEAAKNAK